MKKIISYLQNKDYLFQIHLYIALAFSIPLFDRLVAFIIIIITTQWVFSKNWKHRYALLKQEKWRKILLSYCLFYLVYLIGLLYSTNLDYAFFDLGTKLSLLIFPLIFATTDIQVFNSKRLLLISYAYLAGCILITGIMLVFALLNFSKTNSPRVFYYDELSIFQHPSYLSMYLDFAVSLILYLLLRTTHLISAFIRNFLVFFIVYFFAIVMLLASKAGIISLLIILTISIFSIIIYRKDYVIGLLFLIVLPFSFVGAYYVFPYSFQRLNVVSEVVSGKQQSSPASSDGTADRILIWESSLELIQEQSIFGVGTGDVKDALLKKYEENGIVNALNRKLNAHNQYLQTAITLGLPGIIILLSGLVFAFILAVRRQNLLLLLFSVVVSFNFLVESMLERQAGVVFYSFLNALLLFLVLSEPRNDAD
jgi:O-antigen ligase